jgi:transcription antitermination protein NusB
MDRRTAAREITMQALFQLDVQGDHAVEMIKKFIITSSNDDLVRDLARQWTLDTWKNKELCDSIITSAAIKWQMSRLSPVDRSILRLSTYQINFCPDIPAKVVINEAIELAKKYSSEQAPGFVNGVLDAIMKRFEEQNQNGQGG